MKGNQLRKLEAELWKAADQLRANSKLTAAEYSMPVLGLIFLRHAYNRFLKVKDDIEKNLPVHPQRGKRPVTPQDFEEKSAMFLPANARFHYLVSLPDEKDLGEAIDNAMKEIEEINPKLEGILPKNYSIFSKDLLHELLRIFNQEVLQKAEGDVFGKIYEYFLNKFAMTGAQEGGEFFTPFSLVNTIVNVIEPDHGIVFDPACGSAGMFVQTGYFIESEGFRPTDKVTFYGQEKAETNTKLSKMNLAVHGLEGDILEGNTFYEDKHNLVESCDFVMANPPFNVDGVDKNKDIVKKDPRLPFGLPKNDNANYLWIQYFYSYLKPTGRAGFVMASSASDAGHSEKEIREKLVKTGAVDVMIAIGNNFFYTRSLPCTLWFFDRNKERDKERSQKVLMLDARKIYHKVTQKINDFSPEQLQNLICIVNLYRGNIQKIQDVQRHYMKLCIDNALETAVVLNKLQAFIDGITKILAVGVMMNTEAEKDDDIKLVNHLIAVLNELLPVISDLGSECEKAKSKSNSIEMIANQCKISGKNISKLLKQFTEGMNTLIKELRLNKQKQWDELKTQKYLLPLKEYEKQLFGNPDEEESGLLHDVEYYWKQAHWLTSRFPDGVYRDVEGLCKIVSQEEIAAKDYSLSPGRYVGVDVSTEEDFDYEERLKEIRDDLRKLNEEAKEHNAIIMQSFEEIL